MAALVCDICGGALAMTDNGDFAVCECCGLKHTKERMQVKVQEIKGVVEITKGEAEKERLLNNAQTFLNLKEEQKAFDIYKELTNDYPDDYRGWLGLANATINDGLLLLNGIANNNTDNFMGNPASSLLHTLERLKYLGEKIKILNAEAYVTIDNFEEKVIATTKQLGFMNPIIRAVLLGCAQVGFCSEKIQAFAAGLVTEYIDNFENGKMAELLWCYKNESDLEQDVKDKKLYPAAGNFCLRGLKNAEKINRLSEFEQKRVLLVWGITDINALLRNGRLYFINGLKAFFSESGDINRPRALTVCINEGNIDAEISKAIMVDTRNICGYCGGAFDFLGFCKKCGHYDDNAEYYLCEKLANMLNRSFDKYSLFAELKRNFNPSSYIPSEPWESQDTRRTFSFTEVTPTHITFTYTDTPKGLNLFGAESKKTVLGTVYYSETELKNIYVYMLRRRGLCQHCGSEFSGVFNKVCSVCKRAKDYKN